MYLQEILVRVRHAGFALFLLKRIFSLEDGCVLNHLQETVFILRDLLVAPGLARVGLSLVPLLHLIVFRIDSLVVVDLVNARVHLSELRAVSRFHI